MSLLSQINLNYLRIFVAVYRAGSMTKASKELHLTQSGISQQVKALEDALGVTLFDRINRRIIPTASAEDLYIHCNKYLDEIDLMLSGVANRRNSLVGRVKIGFPPVFGNHTLLPLIAKFSRANPKVKFELRTGLTSEILELLIEGKLDFAFFDTMTKDPHLVTESVGEEVLDLCCRKDLVEETGKFKASAKFFRKLPFAAYVEGEPVIRTWFKKNFQTVPSDLNVVATVIDSRAIARIVIEGMAAGLLPGALVKQIRQDHKDIRVFNVEGRIRNRICVSYLAQREMSAVAANCFNELKHSM